MTACAALVCLGAAAFDSEAWLARIAGFADDAARLRTAYKTCEESTLEPAEGVEVPFETWPDGAEKSVLFLRRARFILSENLIWGEGVKVTQRAKDGSLDARIDAHTVVVDRNTRSGWAKGHARARYRPDLDPRSAERLGADLEGDDIYFNIGAHCLRIATNTVLRARGDELRSVRAVYDYENGVAMFDGDVTVRHVEKGVPYDISCSRGFAFFAGTNDLRKVVALGGVTVVGGGRRGTCDRAVYLRGPGKLALYGVDGAPAKLSDSGAHKGELAGSRITFWIDSEQIEVVNSQITVEGDDIRLPDGDRRKRK